MHRILVGAIAICGVLSADTLRLKSGRTVEGTYLGGDTRSLRFDTGDRVQTFSILDIAEIRFGSTAAESNPGALTPEQPAARAAAQPQPETASRASSGRRGAGRAELAAGTALVVRLIDDVDSQRDSVGKTFQASIDEPVMSGERTLIPRGADVTLKLTEDRQSGKLSGRTELTLDVVSITVNGRAMEVLTEEVTTASSSRTGKTGQVVGGGAALGAIIGAIAGGGKGAAIGAVSGAAAGGAVQVMTKGERVKIPSETRLTFSLQQPLQL